MKFFLLGYMGSGKSVIGKRLASEFSVEFLDLDSVIEKRERLEIPQIFERKGEIYFRKLERQVLEELVNYEKPVVISLGGGTPCYGNNMELIKNAPKAKSLYLKLNVQELTKRLLKEKANRPVISHLKTKDELEEFIRKHLFERGFYYNQSDLIVDCNSKSPEEVLQELKEKLG